MKLDTSLETSANHAVLPVPDRVDGLYYSLNRLSAQLFVSAACEEFCDNILF